MRRAFFHEPAWCRASTLAERVDAFPPVAARPDGTEVDVELARRRLRHWRSQKPFNADEHFAQRLAQDGITEDQFLYLLGEPVEKLHSRLTQTPEWLQEIEDAYSRADEPGVPLPPEFQKQVRGTFLAVIEPLIYRTWERLHEGVRAITEAHAELPFDPADIESILLADLPKMADGLLSRTLALELNITRLQGLLEGGTPAERFASFVKRLRQREASLAVLRDYPVLARQLVIHLDHWLRFQLEILTHLCDDWAAIRATFSPAADPGRLTELVRGAGDPHRGGRSVVLAKFSSGFQLVYKPKSLAIDVHFQELLGWFNERGVPADFRLLKILRRDDYGWVEFVRAEGCATGEEVRRFYERQGQYLALLYLLEATDFHYENLIAAGEHPVLIDLEALFHPRTEGTDVTPDMNPRDGANIFYSVLRVGLLPQRVWTTPEHEGIDLSGLGAAPGQLTPRGVPYWESVGTDVMRVARKRIEIPVGQNRPTLGGVAVDALDYSEAIIHGFESLYGLCVRHREELLADDGPLARFADDEVRFIVRPTKTYALLLQESFHPDMLQNSLERELFLDRLWVGIEQRPFLSKLIPAESHDLQQGDVPMFTTRPNTRDIWTSAGGRIADFLDEPGMAGVRRRVRRLSDRDLEQQRWFIDASLTALSMGVNEAGRVTYEMKEPEVLADPERLVGAARAVGDRLEALAQRGGEDVSWLGVSLVYERHWMLQPLGVDLYNGLPGVALFLAHLGAFTGEERYTQLAQVTAGTFRRSVERAGATIRTVGGYDGWGGLIYTLTHLHALWGQPELLAEAEAMVELLPALIEEDSQLDILAGAAGCIHALLGLHQSSPAARTLAVAVRCGDHLLARAQKMETGLGWQTRVSGATPLAGLSHGAAGIAWALLELAAASGEERFGAAARQAVAYERTLFSPEVGNWPDLRDFSALSGADEEARPPVFSATWCHGAPGVGLARLRALLYLDEAETRGEIDAALETTLREGFGNNHSLCHGDLGNLELLLQAGETLDDPRWPARVRRLSTIILNSIEERGWLCGIPRGVETPGLMTGLAGIGYQLLRLAAPRRIPSVMVLAPPAAKV